jgi:hypothetical protein
MDAAPSREHEMERYDPALGKTVIDLEAAFEAAANVEAGAQFREVDEVAKNIHETIALEIAYLEHLSDLGKCPYCLSKTNDTEQSRFCWQEDAGAVCCGRMEEIMKDRAAA